VRRIKRAAPHLRVGLVIWQMPDTLIDTDSPLQSYLGRVSKEKLIEAEEIGSDFVVTNAADALSAAFQKVAPKPPTTAPEKVRQRAVSQRPSV